MTIIDITMIPCSNLDLSNYKLTKCIKFDKSKYIEHSNTHKKR